MFCLPLFHHVIIVVHDLSLIHILEELAEVADFCLTVGLPVTLADIGIVNPSRQDLMAVAEATCAEGESIYNMPMEITPEKVYAAIVGADAMGRFYKGE